MSIHIVVDLGFGDSGKGLMTDHLASKYPDSLVVRFNGGHQAGHTVCMSDGRRHVFSNFGSGTFRGAPTYWSNYCTIDPLAVIREYKRLITLNVKPKLYIDALCPVTTFFDIVYNQHQEEIRANSKHGSCGVGFGTTIERNLTPYKLYVQDLRYLEVVKLKLNSIRKYYFDKYSLFEKLSIFQDDLDKFINCLKEFNEIVEIVNEKDILPVFKRRGKDFIFEGAQGILLDQDFGFFPHVTRSNTTSKNAIELIERYQLNEPRFRNKISPDVYYVTRAYQTRHGAGPMTNTGIPLDININPLETNKTGQWQDEFRMTPMDVDLLRYAIDCDNNFSEGCKKNLVITCLDQIPYNNIPYTENGKLNWTKDLNSGDFNKGIHWTILPDADQYYSSISPVSDGMISWKNPNLKNVLI